MKSLDFLDEEKVTWVKIPLISVKSLESRNYQNESEAQSKMSVFFIGLNYLLLEEEILLLALKLAEAKEFTDKTVHSLFKKKFNDSFDPLDLKEQLRHTIVFHFMFNGP